MRVKRDRLPDVQVYIEAKRKVSHSTEFSELSGHFQVQWTAQEFAELMKVRDYSLPAYVWRINVSILSYKL